MADTDKKSGKQPCWIVYCRTTGTVALFTDPAQGAMDAGRWARGHRGNAHHDAVVRTGFLTTIQRKEPPADLPKMRQSLTVLADQFRGHGPGYEKIANQLAEIERTLAPTRRLHPDFIIQRDDRSEGLDDEG